MNDYRLHAAAYAVCVCVLLSGCGGDAGGKAGPKRYPVQGKVTLAGQPVTSGEITFGAVDASKGTPDSAVIGPDGSFKVERGLAEGSYVVVVQSYKKPLKDIPPPELAKLGDSNLAVPKKYFDAKTSDLKFTAKAEPNTANFELKE